MRRKGRQLRPCFSSGLTAVAKQRHERRHDVFIDPDDSWMTTMLRAKERGHWVSAIYSPRFALAYPGALALAESAIKIDTSDESALRWAIREAGKRRRIDALLVHRDAILAKVASACRASGVRFTAPEAVRTALSKLQTRRVLQASGLSEVRIQPVRRMSEIAHAVRNVGFPCVLKPAAGHGSRLTFKLGNMREVDAARAQIASWAARTPRRDRWLTAQGFVCEEWLEGPIISIELAVVNGKIRPFAAALGSTTFEDPCSGYGNVIPYRGAPSAIRHCTRYATEVCSAIGFDLGVCDLEMVWTGDSAVLLEANPRKMGGAMPEAFDLATGARFDDIMLDTYAGHAVPIRHTRRKLVTVIRKIMPVHSGRIHTKPIRPWLHSFRPRKVRIHLHNDALHAGSHVRRLQVLGRVLIVSRRPDIGFAYADRATHQLAKEIGLELAAGTLPEVRNVRPTSANTEGRQMTTPDPGPRSRLKRPSRNKRKVSTARKKVKSKKK
jgi:biotin carboxylase